MRTPEEYKKLSVQEFTKAAKRYDSENAGIYDMCKQDYPPILEELQGEQFDTLLDAGCDASIVDRRISGQALCGT